MESKVMTVTPTLAATWLQTNDGNRHVRRFWVDALAYEMKMGKFVTSHQGIAFSKDGRLIDGQHRLLAVIKSGCSVPMMVTKGLDDDAFLVFDNGVKRTVSDITGFDQKTTEVCKVYSGILYGNTHKHNPHICADIAAAGVYALHKELMDYCPTNRKVVSSAPFKAAAIALVLDGHNMEYVFGLYSKLVLLDFDSMPPIAQSFVKQIMADKIKANEQKHSLIARGLKVFNEAYASTSRLIVSQAEIDSVTPFVRSVINNLLEDFSS